MITSFRYVSQTCVVVLCDNLSQLPFLANFDIKNTVSLHLMYGGHCVFVCVYVSHVTDKPLYFLFILINKVAEERRGCVGCVVYEQKRSKDMFIKKIHVGKLK